jgi:hypothetical protein
MRACYELAFGVRPRFFVVICSSTILAREMRLFSKVRGRAVPRTSHVRSSKKFVRGAVCVATYCIRSRLGGSGNLSNVYSPSATI